MVILCKRVEVIQNKIKITLKQSLKYTYIKYLHYKGKNNIKEKMKLLKKSKSLSFDFLIKILSDFNHFQLKPHNIF